MRYSVSIKTLKTKLYEIYLNDILMVFMIDVKKKFLVQNRM